MAATQTQINNYIASIRYAHSLFVNKLATKERLGHKDVFCCRIKMVLLSYYVRMLEDYFAQHEAGGDTYEDYNFFTTEEAADIMQHINAICDTFYTLDIVGLADEDDDDDEEVVPGGPLLDADGSSILVYSGGPYIRVY